MLRRDIYGIAELASDFPREEYVSRCEKARVLMTNRTSMGCCWGRRRISHTFRIVGE